MSIEQYNIEHKLSLACMNSALNIIETKGVDLTANDFSLIHSLTNYYESYECFEQLEEHEQKEPFVPSDSSGVNDAILGNTVEVDQVWRSITDGGLCRVVSIDSLDRPFIEFYEDSEIAGTVNCFFDLYELVTMENIKAGEWVEFLIDYSHEYKCGEPHQLIRKGSKYKICEVVRGLVRIKVNGYVNFVSDGATKPCLPMEEETKEPTKLFDNIDFSDFGYKEDGQDVKARVKRLVKIAPFEGLEEYDIRNLSYDEVLEYWNEHKKPNCNFVNLYVDYETKTIKKAITQEQLDKAVKEAELRGVNKGVEELKELKEACEIQIDRAKQNGFKEGKEHNEKSSDYWYGLGKKNGYSTAIKHVNTSLEATKAYFDIDS